MPPAAHPQPRTPSLTPFCTPAVHNRSVARGKHAAVQWRSPTSAWIETVTNRELVAGVRDARNDVRRESGFAAPSGLIRCHSVSYGSARDACATSWPALDCDVRAGGRAVLGPTGAGPPKGTPFRGHALREGSVPAEPAARSLAAAEESPGPGAPAPQT